MNICHGLLDITRATVERELLSSIESLVCLGETRGQLSPSSSMDSYPLKYLYKKQTGWRVVANKYPRAVALTPLRASSYQASMWTSSHTVYSGIGGLLGCGVPYYYS
ncbi:hypothetical protein SCLCIDRAFT_701788 [Scleroderma citrinum Foug A]|uniref:Uncharacterized protein n=1 Tax=Scleroderma citrinum Foug A TaxID=1036808 RepID=A0A0C3E9K5_9AGAM|nr:hypothetical protein SCLCIDRAFT_701788 [Scleroderma citrinum Foug A]